MGTPVAEFPIDEALVGGLLADQHPDLADLRLEAVDAGWDNSMFRLGERLAIRLPRRAAAAGLIAHEQDWLPRLADRLALPIPVPYRAGRPGRGYPWSWSVVPWLNGVAADQEAPRAAEALRFAAFLHSLHTPAAAGAPANPFRGVPLHTRAAAVAERLQRLAVTTSLITPALEAVWQQALEAPIDLAPTWLHGDLHPRNVLVAGGTIAGIIDWGDLTAGDRATDLASIWMLFEDRRARQAALAAYPDLTAATLRRAKGWVVLFGAMLLDSGLVDSPRHAVIGERALRRVVEPLEPG